MIMKSIFKYIQEKYLIDDTEIIAYSGKTNKEIMVKKYADDKETLENFINFYNNLVHYNLFKYSRIYLCKKENDKWIANVNKNYQINNYQPNYRFLYSNKSNYYTYNQLLEMLNSGNYLLILSENTNK